jgi:hypothetical protein
MKVDDVDRLWTAVNGQLDKDNTISVADHDHEGNLSV